MILRQRTRPWSLGLLLILFAAMLSACDREPAQVVSLEKRSSLPPPPAADAEGGLTLSIGSMITPQEGYVYYRRLVDYLGDRLGRPIHVTDPGNYREVNLQLERGETNLAFVCGGPYVEGRDRFGLVLLAAPVVHGEQAYHSLLLVPAGSPVKALADLRGKSFAFTDPQSNSGFLVPAAELARIGKKPHGFFASYLFTYGHDRSIEAVAEGLVDGAAVDSLIWDFLVAKRPELAEKVKVVARFGPFGIPPVVASPHLDTATRDRVKSILLGMHGDPRGREILAGMMIERFAEARDADYDAIRDLERRVRTSEWERVRQ